MTRERLRKLCDQGIHLALIAMLLVIPLVFYTYAYDVFEYNKITAFRLLTLLALLAYFTKTLLIGREPVKASPLKASSPLLIISCYFSWSTSTCAISTTRASF